MKKRKTVEELIALLNEPNWWDRAFCNEVVNGHSLTLEESRVKAQMEREGKVLRVEL